MLLIRNEPHTVKCSPYSHMWGRFHDPSNYYLLHISVTEGLLMGVSGKKRQHPRGAPWHFKHVTFLIQLLGTSLLKQQLTCYWILIEIECLVYGSLWLLCLIVSFWWVNWNSMTSKVWRNQQVSLNGGGTLKKTASLAPGASWFYMKKWQLFLWGNFNPTLLLETRCWINADFNQLPSVSWPGLLMVQQ